jgi:protoporphyrin/coproporphyrin ferrochelatase
MNKKIGILLINLGTPSKATPKEIRRFLKAFLSDPRVVEIPPLLWKVILNGLILPRRPKKVAKLYQSIWTQYGSPLLDYSQGLADKIQLNLGLEDFIVTLGMCYSAPSIEQAYQKLAGCESIIILPLYPQNAASTTGAAFDKVSALFKNIKRLPEFYYVNSYAKNVHYIKILKYHIEKYWEIHGKSEKLLFSYHGLPKKSIEDGDPYYEEACATTQLLTKALHLNDKDWILTFQSRFGPAQWLTPYTSTTLEQLGKEGVKSVDVICPGFAVDCLETLEEIDKANRETFIKAGGIKFNYIPALNDSDEHAHMLEMIIKDKLESILKTYTHPSLF